MEVPEQVSNRVRVVVKSNFDHDELRSKICSSREEVETYIDTNKDDDVVVFDLEDVM